MNPDFQPLGVQPKDADYPGQLNPVDDLPPQTIITHVLPQKDGGLHVIGTTADNGAVKQVLVNGKAVTATAENFSQWQISLPKAAQLTAHAEDTAGNIELRPHTRSSVE